MAFRVGYFVLIVCIRSTVVGTHRTDGLAAAKTSPSPSHSPSHSCSSHFLIIGWFKSNERQHKLSGFSKMSSSHCKYFREISDFRYFTLCLICDSIILTAFILKNQLVFFISAMTEASLYFLRFHATDGKPSNEGAGKRDDNNCEMRRMLSSRIANAICALGPRSAQFSKPDFLFRINKNHSRAYVSQIVE